MSALEGKVALITGGARRIGRVLALTLARAGADIVFTYRNSADEAESLVRAISALEREALAVRCDLRDPVSLREAVKEAVEFDGRLDILVNNAGAYRTTNFADISVEEWDEMFETNARAPFLLSQAAAPELRKSSGTIINIGSLGGIHGWATHAHYSASKAALHMLTQATAKALAPEINVNAVAPGMIYFGEPAGAEMARHFAAKTPMQRTGTAEDVAAAVLWFAGCPKFITGQILAVDGGLGL
ncbi:MAG: SDR family oxidoreductase [Acidobacteriaceae bacterium]